MSTLNEQELEALIMCVGRVISQGQKKAFGHDLKLIQQKLRGEQQEQKSQREDPDDL